MSTKKVLEIKQLLEGDNLAGVIHSKYRQWRDQRVNKETEWRELRNYIFATDTTKTTNSKLPWKNKTTVPKLTQIRDNLHANYRSALFSNEDWLKWDAYTKDSADKNKARAIEGYMKNKLRESGFEETIEKLLYDYIDYGNAFAEVVFISEYKVDEFNGERINGYTGPKLLRTSPYDITFDPTAYSFKKSPKITRYIKTLGELKSEVEDRPELNYLPDTIERLEAWRNSLSTYSTEDLNKAEAFSVDGFGSLSEYFSSGYVEILEFEGDIHDIDTGVLLKDYIITVVDRKWVVRKEQNPSWLGNSSREHIGWRERPDNLYAMGPLDNLVGMQYRLDHLENLKADAFDLTIHPPIKIIGDVEPFTWGPNSVIIIPDSDGDVIPLPPNPAALNVNTEISFLQQQMEEMAGAPKEAMGIRSAGEKTAFEVQQLQNAAGRIFQDKVSKFEKYFMEPLINTMFEVSKRNMESADIVRVMDDDLGVIAFLEVTKDDITAKGKLKPVGARHFAQQAQLVQNLTGIFNSPAGQMILPHISSKALAKTIEDVLNFERYGLVQDNIAIMEQAETQRLAQQAQQQVMTEGMTPLEEGEY